MKVLEVQQHEGDEWEVFDLVDEPEKDAITDFRHHNPQYAQVRVRRVPASEQTEVLQLLGLSH